MIRISIYFGAVLLLLLAGCKRGINFDLNYSTSFTVPSSIGISVPVSLPTPDVETNSEQEFENNDTKTKWVQNIFLERLQATVINPANGDFDFLKSIYIYIDADGLDEIELASMDPVPANVGNTIVLTASGQDFAEYIKKDKYSLRAEVITDEAPLFDVTFDIDMTFDVTANAPAFQ